MENVAALRAQNGATMSRLSFRKSTFRAAKQHGGGSWSDQGYRHGGRKYPTCKVQRIKAGVRGDACTGEHFPGKSPSCSSANTYENQPTNTKIYKPMNRSRSSSLNDLGQGCRGGGSLKSRRIKQWQYE